MNNVINLTHQDDISSNTRPWILVVTPLPKLGEIISDSLKEHMEVEYTSRASWAVSRLSRHPECKHAILDMEMGELNILELGHTLRNSNPNIELIFISNQDPPTDFEELLPWKFLHKPLLLTDIQAVLGIAVSPEGNTSNIIDLDAFDKKRNSQIRWSENVGLATQYLETMIEKSYAQEVLIIHDRKVWSYAGRLSENRFKN